MVTRDAQQIWETSLGQLQLLVPRPSYDTWLKGTTGLALDGEWLTVGAPTPFAAEWLERRMHQLIQRTVTEVATRPLQVRFQVATPQRSTHPAEVLVAEPDLLHQASQDDAPQRSTTKGMSYNGTFNHRYTLQNFVVGQTNQLAHAAATAVAQHPGEQYNPLFIYSGVGLGKTHLLCAIAADVAKRDLQPLYVTTERFANDFIQAIRERKTDDFRTKYRSADVLLLDDIQFLAGKEQTQECFFHTFNDLHNTNRQIVVACDRPPQSVKLLEDRLRSRFEWGLLTDIQPPELETRIAILHNKAQAMGVKLPEDIALLIAQRARHNVRELESCVNRLIALSQFLGKPISGDLAATAMADLSPSPPQQASDPYKVIQQVASHYQINPETLCTRPHSRKTAQPQRLAMYILGEILKNPLQDVAHLLGSWHLRTVRNAIKEIAHQLPQDPSLQTAVTAILNNVGVAST